MLRMLPMEIAQLGKSSYNNQFQQPIQLYDKRNMSHVAVENILAESG